MRGPDRGLRYDRGVRHLGFVAVVIAGWLALGAGLAEAQIYHWVDERGVAHYTEGIDRVPQRYRATAVPLGFRNRPSPPPTSDPTVAPGPAGATVIRFTPGQRIMVDARVNGSARVRLLLDTGADGTLISPRALAAAGVSLTRTLGRRTIHGVTGADQIDYVLVESLEVGEARVGQLAVAAYEMREFDGDGLLGRDFLDRFTVTIDSTQGLVTLVPR
jgi:hypothetical protein